MKFHIKRKIISLFIFILILNVIWISGTLYLINAYFLIKGSVSKVEDIEDTPDYTINYRNATSVNINSSTLKTEGAIILNIVDKVGVPLYAVLGTHFMETNLRFNGESISGTGALGSMQFQPSTWNADSSTWVKLTGEAAKQQRLSLGIKGFENFKFEYVPKEMYSKFSAATVKGPYGFNKVAIGNGYDYNGDGIADPKNFGDALLSTSIYLKNFKLAIDKKYTVTEEESWYLASICYISGGGQSLDAKMKYLLPILTEVQKKEGSLFFLSDTNIKNAPRSVYQKQFYDVYVNASDFGGTSTYNSTVPRYAFGVLNSGSYLAVHFTDFFGGGIPGLKYTHVPKGFFSSPFKDKSYAITSGFGKRIAPKKGATTWHSGVDLSTIGGEFVIKDGKRVWVNYIQPIYATAPGYIFNIQREEDKSQGYYVGIYHPTINAQTRYLHLAEPCKLKEGDWVDKNTILGMEGNTGTSTSAHLHYEILFDLNFKMKGNNFANVEKFSRSLAVDPLLYNIVIRTGATKDNTRIGPNAINH